VSGYHGKGKKRKRGAHRRARSPETRVWEQDHLLPAKPSWMTETVYRELARLRSGL
jgi:hypothetical protein